MFHLKSWSIIFGLAAKVALVNAVSSLQVETTVGRVYGMINGTTPDVAQFLGIPFAEPPVNSLRFRPPVKKSPVGKIDATRLTPSCPQTLLTTANDPSVYTYDTPWLQPYGTTSEDCLSLSIWAPLTVKGNVSEPLPVLVWIFGGGFVEGGMMTNGFIPSNWVQRSQELIVVSINYRVNIFGFPNARGIQTEDLNPGLLDQRMSIEWVRDNIAAFGGDPSKITIWGQSAGAAAVDFYNYAYPDDPIAAGIIQHSGSVFATGSNHDSTHSNFTFIASQVGCGNLTAENELACMQNANQTDIEALIEDYDLNFNTVVDNRTKFANYTIRANAGNYSKVPCIMGTNANEEASLIAWVPTGPNATLVHEETLSIHLCPAAYSNKLRYETGSTTFRYYNTANFSNISPRPWEGAYHTSELPLLFGTYADYGGSATPFETAVSTHWQDLYLAFMKDPVNGLPAMGWPVYTPEGYAMEFAANGTVSQLRAITSIEAECAGVPVAH